MTTPVFNTLSHTDFLRLTLEAFSRQGFEVERSSDAGADAVLVSKSGTRIAVLCKKYRDAFIGRPVLTQFHAAMHRLGCKEGYLITTTDCSPDAHEFAKGKGLELYNRDRTTRMFLTAFGDGFMRTGRLPELGQKAKVVPAPVRAPVSAATYEKVAVPDRKAEREPEKPAEPAQAQEPVTAAVQEMPSPPAAAPEPERAAGPAQTIEEEPALQEKAAVEELPEEVETVEDLGAPAPPEPASLLNTRTIFCAECNKPARVPTDQGIIKVTCSECGSRWLYQPEMTIDGEVKTTTVIACQTCSQQLNVPVNRGQLNVRCPKCGAKWLFTP